MCSTHANLLECQAKTGPAVIQKSVRPSFDIFAPVCYGLDRPGCRAAMWLVRALGQCAVPAYGVSAWLGSAPLSLLSQASLRPMSPLSAPSVSGANVGVARVAKPSSLLCSSKATEIVADASKATLQAIIRGKVAPNSISTPTAGEAATGWLIWVWASPFGSITAATNSSRAADTSTASSLFGAMPNIGWRSFMTCDVASSRCISRTLSCVSITAILISTRHCLDCSGTSLCEAFAS